MERTHIPHTASATGLSVFQSRKLRILSRVGEEGGGVRFGEDVVSLSTQGVGGDVREWQPFHRSFAYFFHVHPHVVNV